MFSPEIVIHVEKVKREREYEELQKSPRSPFKDKEMWVIFLGAMMVGYREKTRTPLKGARHDLFRASTLKSEEEWLIRSVAIAEKGNLDIFLEEKEILNIAEEYANAGILILYDMIFGGELGDPIKKVEHYVKDVLV